MGYSGVPRGIPTFRSSIVPAATVIQEIEAWLPEYTKKNASGQISPEGWIAAVHSGWPDRPAFPSATTEILVDIRITPRTPPSDVKAQFGDQMNRICRKHPEIDLDWEMIASCPTGSTDPDNWIIHSAQRGWERVEGKKHPNPRATAGRRTARRSATTGFRWRGWAGRGPMTARRRNSPMDWAAWA